MSGKVCECHDAANANQTPKGLKQEREPAAELQEVFFKGAPV